MRSVAADYDGNNMLAVLGQSISSATFKDFKDFWLLDKSYQNFNRGIKIYINPINDKVESIIVAGEALEMGGAKFNRCNAALPYGIIMDDDTAGLINKLGHGEKLLGRSTLKFYKGEIAVEASFTDLKAGKIYFLKFSTDTKHNSVVTTPLQALVKKEDIIEKHRQIERNAFLSGSSTNNSGINDDTKPVDSNKKITQVTENAIVPVEPITKDTITTKRIKEKQSVSFTGNTSLQQEQYTGPKTVSVKKDTSNIKKLIYPSSKPASQENVIDKNRRLQQAAFFTEENAGNSNTSKHIADLPKAPLTPFKRALLEVFKAARENSLDSIKRGERGDGNFWNYKYTYNTKLKIPGEKYSMLYSFPFVTSQFDFVVVLKESDSFDRSIESMYHSFEKQLTESFPASEGWIASCLPGKDKNHLPDLEFRNDKYGAVILDHTQNPKGRHVLYLRFLLFSE